MSEGFFNFIADVAPIGFSWLDQHKRSAFPNNQVKDRVDDTFQRRESALLSRRPCREFLDYSLMKSSDCCGINQIPWSCFQFLRLFLRLHHRAR